MDAFGSNGIWDADRFLMLGGAQENKLLAGNHKIAFRFSCKRRL